MVTAPNCVTLAGTLCLLFGCGRAASAPEPKMGGNAEVSGSSVHSFEVDASYGTLSFRGKIDRADRGARYEYRAHIDVTFHSNAAVNRTPVIDLRECRLVATVPPEVPGPWHVLYEDARQIRVRLTEDGQTAHLPELTFRLPKEIAAKAQRVGLAVDDGHRMWPIPVDLQ